ncbi:glycosyltransferase family 2 protein [Burkholderia plantarii]|uniref:Putative nucleotide-diphospho-sugar transferases superfamily n=1 Tax=Burkholderia plantarii TaxID=41899 RepID=A0A0B6S982_BURPL|nr:glycosyltransferase family 2 protein [Burkholderia plantarii]AJK50989.1 putative nucleotide-diphospho-sugar transferases superfamily [Burkholderia plantarii]WLE61396.1 glycosyltransferase family 2 protein [Burkholderia plantarii]
MNPHQVAVVVTGRDRDGTLARCLRSVRAADWRELPVELLYATDDPHGADAVRAARHGARVVAVEPRMASAPAGPAVTRAALRNAGWRASGADTVLFLGADTLLDRAFPKRALARLEAAGCAAVRGQCREALPHQSPYAAVVDLDGLMPSGDALDRVGDALFRRAALEEVGGFDANLADGEAADLCRRLAARRWWVDEPAIPMARHDDVLAGFRDYWRRAVRIGEAYAAADARCAGRAAFPHGYAPQRNRAHGSALGVAALLLAVTLALAPAAAWGLVALFGAALLHTAWRARPGAGDWRLATLYALHAHLQQLPILYGQLAYRRRHAAAARPRRAPRHLPGGVR